MSLLKAQEIYETVRARASALEAEVWALRQVAAPPAKKILTALDEAKTEILKAIEESRTVTQHIAEVAGVGAAATSEIAVESLAALLETAKAEKQRVDVALEEAGRDLNELRLDFRRVSAEKEGLEREVDRLRSQGTTNDLYRETLAKLNETRKELDAARERGDRLQDALFKQVTASDALREKPIPSSAVKAARKAYDASSAVGFDETMGEVAEAVRKALVEHFLAEGEGA